MTQHFLGADLGATKTHILIIDDAGNVESFIEGGPGNHEAIGYDGLQKGLTDVIGKALRAAGLDAKDISGSGFGVAGYDWPSEREPILQMIRTLNLGGIVELVNDCDLGLLAGSPNGWGVTVVSGTGCNCRGWDETRTRFGRVTGGGYEFGEFAGAVELLFMTVRALSYAWTGRGQATALSDIFVEKYQRRDLGELLQDLLTRKLILNPEDARLVFLVADAGDPVANELIRSAGHELGEMANTVIRQLNFEKAEFDLTLIGSMFDGSPLLADEMKNTVYAVAPGARFIRVEVPPVIGAVLLGMEAAGVKMEADTRNGLLQKMASAIRKES